MLEIKGANLEWIQVYLLLFRDVMTKKCLVRFVKDLEENTLLQEWKYIIQHLKSKGIEVKMFGTDGKQEYHKYIQKINQELGFKIEHVYDSFHFEKNLYESANEEIFGNKYSKKQLPDHVLNQIKTINSFFNSQTEEEANTFLTGTLLFQKNTFLKSLQHHILRLEKYFDDYTILTDIYN